MRILMLLFCFSPLLLFGQGTTPGWETFSFGTPPISLRLPGSPLPQSSNLPARAMAYVKDYKAYYLQDEEKGLVITMMHAFYANDVIADSKGAAQGTNTQWEATGSKVVVVSTTENKISGKSAIQQRGKLLKAGKEHDFVDIIAVEGSKLWQVIIMAPANDPALKSLVQKIVDSIKF